MNRAFQIPALLFSMLMISSCIDTDPTSSASFPVSIGSYFQVAYTQKREVEPQEVVDGLVTLDFQVPSDGRKLDRYRKDIWLKAQFPAGKLKPDTRVIELPGHLFHQVDAWFITDQGVASHQQTGRVVAYDQRPVKYADVAFNIPEAVWMKANSQSFELLLRMNVGVPVNFAAQLWSESSWHQHVMNQRLWYGLFVGGILILMVYNLFFALMLRQASYLYYVGYILTLATCVISYTSLPEEYLFHEGGGRIYLLSIATCAIFFAIGFVNSFLDIKQRYPRIFRASTAVALLSVLFGTMFTFRIPLFSPWWNGNIMHTLLLLGAAYFLGISLFSYFQRRKEARFLALSIIALIAGLTAYLLYTYGVLAYHPILIHAVEAGALLEGVLLSLALAERVRLANRQKEKAETAALDAQKYFSRHLLKAQEAERERFSSAMHDSIGHGMLVLKQGLDNTQTLLGQADSFDKDTLIPIQKSLSNQIEYSGEILDDIRGLSHDLHPHLLHRLGLAAALQSTLERAFSDTEIEWHAEIGTLPHSLPDDVQITAYRVVQEAVNNIIKHAEANEVILIVNMENQHLVICIKDDGNGFDMAAELRTGLGLSGMQDRIRLFGGWLEVRSGFDLGTEINFGIPVHLSSV